MGDVFWSITWVRLLSIVYGCSLGFARVQQGVNAVEYNNNNICCRVRVYFVPEVVRNLKPNPPPLLRSRTGSHCECGSLLFGPSACTKKSSVNFGKALRNSAEPCKCKKLFGKAGSRIKLITWGCENQGKR
jgi:hypothetical protein